MPNHAPIGFRFAGVAAGIKKTGAADLALIASDRPCSTAAVFTQNAFPAAPVIYDRALVAENPAGLRAVVINAGCANACTGAVGLGDAEKMAQEAEATLELPPRSAAVMSTGVIGARLPTNKIASGVRQAARQLSEDGWNEASGAIMTTDTRPKVAFRQIHDAHILGMCKGAGMIHPNMATMLAVIVTDAAVEPGALAQTLRSAADVSFNAISIDGDTSTNDTVLVLANGASGWKAEAGSAKLAAFAATLTDLCTDLAQQIVRDGEGATKFITIQVEGAASDAEAKRAAKAIANSALVKTAFYGGDANWGRILAAVGYSGATVDPGQTDLWITEGTIPTDRKQQETGSTARALQLVRDGEPLPYSEAAASAVFAGPEITVVVRLGLGDGQATIWTCDLSHDYVNINGHYRT